MAYESDKICLVNTGPIAEVFLSTSRSLLKPGTGSWMYGFPTRAKIIPKDFVEIIIMIKVMICCPLVANHTKTALLASTIIRSTGLLIAIFAILIRILSRYHCIS